MKHRFHKSNRNDTPKYQSNGSNRGNNCASGRRDEMSPLGPRPVIIDRRIKRSRSYSDNDYDIESDGEGLNHNLGENKRRKFSHNEGNDDRNKPTQEERKSYVFVTNLSFDVDWQRLKAFFEGKSSLI